MNTIAFVFTVGPHGTSAGREGLDAVLATAALSEQVALFFIGDGVLQLTAGQQPEKILARNYIPTFGVLSLYAIDQCYLCAQSLAERGISLTDARVLNTTVLDSAALRAQLDAYDVILTF